MLFDALNIVLQGSFDISGLSALRCRKGTPQTIHRAQTLRAEVLSILSSVAQRLTGQRPYFAMSRLAQKGNATQQHFLEFETGSII